MAAVTDIRYVGYALPDLAAERAFYTDVWGLVDAGERDGVVYLAARGDDEHHVVRLRQDPTQRIDVIAFAAETDADVEAIHQTALGLGHRIVHPPRPLDAPGGGYGFRMFSPDGLTLEVSSNVASRVAQPIAHWDAIPVKISHVVLHSPDHRALVQFFQDVLGFRISDWLGEMMCFLRCNPAHHRIGILPGPPCLNHVAYDMLSVDDMMRGIARMQRHQHKLLWGPGRHTAGNNTFSYFVTPAGFAVEYTSEVAEIDEASWRPTVYQLAPGLMDQWGVGVGGPQTMPHPAPDAGLFVAAPV